MYQLWVAFCCSVEIKVLVPMQQEVVQNVLRPFPKLPLSSWEGTSSGVTWSPPPLRAYLEHQGGAPAHCHTEKDAGGCGSPPLCATSSLRLSQPLRTSPWDLLLVMPANGLLSPALKEPGQQAPEGPRQWCGGWNPGTRFTKPLLSEACVVQMGK